jgi:hypothetical protein
MRSEHVLLAMGCSTQWMIVGLVQAKLGPTGTRARCVVRACSVWLDVRSAGK